MTLADHVLQVHYLGIVTSFRITQLVSKTVTSERYYNSLLEADLVAHCRGNTNSPWLNTLVLVDISTGCLKCMPLPEKTARYAIDSLRVADELLPSALQEFDTDCGSEFINYALSSSLTGLP
jgi:hypothetical protein